MNEQFIKRLKSFGWRTGMMILAFGVAFAMDEIKMLELEPVMVTVIGLILGEVSKFLNTELAKN
jgi:hypothetical protein